MKTAAIRKTGIEIPATETPVRNLSSLPPALTAYM